MVKDAKYIDDIANGSTPSIEPQVVAFKATKEKKALPSKVEQVEFAGLKDEEMALIIKHIKSALKGHKDYNTNKSKGKHVCFKCGKSSHFITNYLDNNDD
jgi:SNF2 family DNA or RNA helicase